MSAPATIGFVLLAITSTGWAKVAFFIAAATNAIAVVYWIKGIVRFLRRLKGSEKEAFLILYYQLQDATVADDVVSIVIAIREMARIRESSFEETRGFVFRRAGTFLSVVGNLPLRIPSMWMCNEVLGVLDANLDQLPRYLSHKDDYIRKAASLRLEELLTVPRLARALGGLN